MPKLVASLFSGCGGLDLGFTGGFNFRGHEYPRLVFELEYLQSLPDYVRARLNFFRTYTDTFLGKYFE